MSWLCHNCETDNNDSDDICVVCNSIPPVLSIKSSDYTLGGYALLTWEEKSHINKLTIKYRGEEIDVTGSRSYHLIVEKNVPIVFVAENDVAKREFVLIPPPPIYLAKYCIICGNYFKDGESFCMRCGGRRCSCRASE